MDECSKKCINALQVYGTMKDKIAEMVRSESVKSHTDENFMPSTIIVLLLLLSPFALALSCHMNTVLTFYLGFLHFFAWLTSLIAFLLSFLMFSQSFGFNLHILVSVVFPFQVSALAGAD